jgi:hypothetical protein
MRIFVFLAAFLFVPVAYAAPPVCDAGAEGTIIYNKDHKIVQFCNGTQWIGMVARIGDDGDTLADLSCAGGEIAKFNGTIWACAADAAGTGGFTALTGDVTASGTGSVAATIAGNAVTSAKILDGTVSNADLAGSIAISKLSVPGGTASFLRADGTWVAPPSGADNLGNHIATQSIVSDTTNTDDLGSTAIRWKDGWFAGTVTGGTFSGSGASLTALNATNLGSGSVPAARMPALTGDVTMAAGTTATAIAAGAVTSSELADDAGTIPKLAATGTASATTFLRGDNTWAAVAAGGGVSAVTTASAPSSTTVASCPAGYYRTGCSSSSDCGKPQPSGSGCKCPGIGAGACAGACFVYCAK